MSIMSCKLCGYCHGPTATGKEKDCPIQHEVKELLAAYGRGTTDYYRNKIVMMSENFVVIRTPGHADWSGVGSRDYYPSQTVLIRKGEWCLASNGEGREEWEGRISNKRLKERLNAAEIRGRVEPQIHQTKESTRL